MSLSLKSTADITAVIADPAFSAVDLARKQQIVGHFTAMPADRREQALNIEITALPVMESEFAQALFTGDGSGTSATPPAVAPDAIIPVADISAISAIPTAGRSPGALTCSTSYQGKIGFWRTRAGTDAQTVPAIIRPNDFHATSNPQVWEEQL